MLIITFHGGKRPSNNQVSGRAAISENSPTPVNNIYAYSDKGGEPLETNVLRGAEDYLKDAELRGMAFHKGDLYVINGHKDANQILRFKGSGTEYEFKNIFASRTGHNKDDGINSIFHPFALTFQGKHCYVSNQDTNIVTRLKCKHHNGKTAAAAAISPSLPSNGKFLDGTFVACSRRQLPGLSPVTPVPLPHGLDVYIDPASGRVHFSVRDILASGKFLYVCDEPAGMIKVYDLEGRLRHFSNPVPRPVHLHAHKGVLYLSGGDQFMAAKRGEFPLYFSAVGGIDGKDVSGVTFDSNGDKLYVANRKEDNISCHVAKRNGGFSKGTSVIENMPDHPEFILYVAEK